MTLNQLRYLVAVARWKSFSEAAARCFVTQPTLSMQIQALEEELGLQLFDRSRKPIVITEAGREMVAAAEKVLRTADRMRARAEELKGGLTGTIRLGVLPTIGPYLLPLMVPQVRQRLPGLQMHIEELPTRQIVTRLLSGELDMGILATPLKRKYPLDVQPLYRERLLAYVADTHPQYGQSAVCLKSLRARDLWLLTEEHCLRSQVMAICQPVADEPGSEDLIFESGSIETLIRMVDASGGLTIIPELAVHFLSADARTRLRPIARMKPAREISLLTARDFARKRLKDEFRKLTRESIEPLLQPEASDVQVIPVPAEVLG